VVTATISGTATDLATLNVANGANNAYAVTVTDAATIAQLAAIDAATTGALTYTAGGVSDTAATLATNAGAYVAAAINVTISGTVAASIAQLVAINAATTGVITLNDATKTANYTDTAANLTAAFAGTITTHIGTLTAIDIDLSAIAAIGGGVGGFVINGQAASDLSGLSVSAAGDVNGDGLADLIVGAPASSPADGANAGRSYVVFGATDGVFSQTAVDYMGTTGNDSHTASAAGQTLVGNAGDDTLTSSGATVLYGGSGNDTFVLDAVMISAPQTNGLVNGVYARIDGGSGGGGGSIDTIQVSSNLDLTSIANQGQSADGSHSRISSVEVIDLSAGGNQTLTLKLIDVLDMTGFNSFASTGRHQLLVKGAAGDVVDLADGVDTTGWTKSGTFTDSGSVVYDAWNHNTSLATVYAQQGMSVI